MGAFILFQPKFMIDEEVPIVEGLSKLSWASNNCDGEYLVGSKFDSFGKKESTNWNPGDK